MLEAILRILNLSSNSNSPYSSVIYCFEVDVYQHVECTRHSKLPGTLNKLLVEPWKFGLYYTKSNLEKYIQYGLLVWFEYPE